MEGGERGREEYEEGEEKGLTRRTGDKGKEREICLERIIIEMHFCY